MSMLRRLWHVQMWMLSVVCSNINFQHLNLPTGLLLKMQFILKCQNIWGKKRFSVCVQLKRNPCNLNQVETHISTFATYVTQAFLSCRGEWQVLPDCCPIILQHCGTWTALSSALGVPKQAWQNVIQLRILNQAGFDSEQTVISSSSLAGGGLYQWNLAQIKTHSWIFEQMPVTGKLTKRYPVIFHSRLN